MIGRIWVLASLIGATVFAQSEVTTASRAAYNVGGNLGFAYTRTQQQSPEQPLNEAGRQWVLRDLEAAYRWSGTLASCVQFDVSRFQSAYSLLTSSNPPAGQMWRVVDQLQRDYASAIARASCAFNVASPQQLDGLYQAGFAVGIATGRSSHFYIDQRLPADASAYIRNDVMQMRPPLQAVAACLGPLDAIDASIGSVLSRLTDMPARLVYEEITKIYIAVETRTINPACSPASAPRPVPNPMPGNDLGACMQSKCGNVCQGAMIMLGEVSGSPEWKVTPGLSLKV